MNYLIFGFSILWICTSVYMLILDRQIKDIGRRLKARTRTTESQSE